MNIHEFGERGQDAIVLIHPSAVTWDYFEKVIPLLENEYRLLIPALPGYDLDDDSVFTSVEESRAHGCRNQEALSFHLLPPSCIDALPPTC